MAISKITGPKSKVVIQVRRTITKSRLPFDASLINHPATHAVITATYADKMIIQVGVILNYF